MAWRPTFAIVVSTLAADLAVDEMFSGAVKSVHGVDHLYFALVSMLEETLELLGLVLFVYALTDYVARQGTRWRRRFDAP